MAEYIEREAAITKCREIAACEWNHRASPVSWADAYEQFAEDLEELPSSNVSPVRRGRWIIGEMDIFGAPIHCSECGWGSNNADPNKWMKYQGHRCCGFCGAKMEGVE